jgi:O-antigen ligase
MFGLRIKIKMRNDKKLDSDFSNLGRKERICKKIIEYGLLSLIVFSPLPAASVEEWSILVIQLTVFIMMAAYLMMRGRRENNELLSSSLKWPRYLFFALFIFIFLQIVPLPKFIVKILSPHTYSFQNLFSTDFLKIKFMSLSIIPSHTLQKGLELLSYILLGFLIIKTIRKWRQIKRVFSVLIIMGVFEAFYGLFELYNKNPRILFYKKIYYLDSATGTFVNRNHFSGYLEMVIPLALGLIIARVDLFSLAGLRWREKILRLSERGFSTTLLIAVGVILMSLGIIFSKSRSGVFLLVFTFILFFGSTMIYFGGVKHQRRGIKNFLIAVFLIVVFISLFIGIDATFERFAMDKLLREERPAVWANTIGIFRDSPLFGAGLGTFNYVYPAYEDSEQFARYSHAHNDYLEYLVELGIFGFALILGGILFLLINSFLIWQVRRHSGVKGLALGGMIAVICMLIHSITDFNLQIPANMLLFSVVLSMTVAAAFYKRDEGTNREKKLSYEEKKAEK